jgi:DNA repair exonuclease SbcCD ATPase subunit
MQTLDEQLDAAIAEKRDLETQLADAKGLMDEALKENETLTAANKELKEQAEHATGLITGLETDLKASQVEADKLKAEAKSAEERAAEYYGAAAPKPAPVTPKGDSQGKPIAEQLAAITDPVKQTAFWQKLTDDQRSELLAAQ